MFTYKVISKGKDAVTIKLLNEPEEIYVPAQSAKNEDYSNFTI